MRSTNTPDTTDVAARSPHVNGHGTGRQDSKGNSRRRMRRLVLLVLLLAVAGAAVGVAWQLTHRNKTARELALHGNVDLRQVALAFNNSERIADVLVQEGDRVRRGQVLARLEPSRLEPQVAQAEAQVAAQRQIVARLHAGSRPEEIAQARANVASAKADAINARRQYERLRPS